MDKVELNKEICGENGIVPIRALFGKKPTLPNAKQVGIGIRCRLGGGKIVRLDFSGVDYVCKSFAGEILRHSGGVIFDFDQVKSATSFTIGIYDERIAMENMSGRVSRLICNGLTAFHASTLGGRFLTREQWPVDPSRFHLHRKLSPSPAHFDRMFDWQHWL